MVPFGYEKNAFEAPMSNGKEISSSTSSSASSDASTTTLSTNANEMKDNDDLDLFDILDTSAEEKKSAEKLVGPSGKESSQQKVRNKFSFKLIIRYTNHHSLLNIWNVF